MRVAPATIHVSALVLALGCNLAQAAPPERDREPPRAAPAPQREQKVERNERAPAPAPLSRNESRGDGRIEPRQADNRVDDLRRDTGTHQNTDAFRRNGRLTADERKDLRRQINEAGQDIYPNTPRR